MKKKSLILTKEHDVVIYTGPKGNVSLRAQIEKDTIWATQEQMSQLFGTKRPAVTKHIKNIIKEGELKENAVCSILEHTARDGKTYKTQFYNLDAIIAVGYRVNSKYATQFRIWATETLRDYLLHGYVLNKQKLIQSKHNTIKELEKAIGFIQSVATRKKLDQDEMTSLLSVIKDYAHSFSLLNRYDTGDVEINITSQRPRDFSYENIFGKIQTLKTDLMKRKEATEIFAQERGADFKGIIGNIHQTFDGNILYKSVEERAAHLLYFIIKDHPFVDGNKRTGAFLFIHYLDLNKRLYRKNGERIINDNALTAIALLVAESDPKEKEQMVALITQLIR